MPLRSYKRGSIQDEYTEESDDSIPKRRRNEKKLVRKEKNENVENTDYRRSNGVSIDCRKRRNVSRGNGGSKQEEGK